jgi:hypothetical protein
MRTITYHPFWVIAILDCFPKILTISIGILSSRDLLFFPQSGGQPLLSLETKFDQLGLTFVSDEAECMDTPTVHVPVRANCAMATHGPKQSMHRRWLLAEEVPCTIVGGCSLGDFIVASWLDCMYEVRKLDGILGSLAPVTIGDQGGTYLNKEDRYIVSNNIWCLLGMVHTDRIQLKVKTHQSYPHRYRTGWQSRAHLGLYQLSHGYQQRLRIE